MENKICPLLSSGRDIVFTACQEKKCAVWVPEVKHSATNLLDFTIEEWVEPGYCGLSRKV
jgi:hypothetical protein